MHMTTNDQPQVPDTPPVTMVPVKRYDITLTMDDILAPLTQTAANLAQAQVGSATDPTVAEHLQKFTDLVSQLKEVSSNINSLDPTLLASKAGPPPSADPKIS
jgi:ABC-type transporter Mla subunit MlaD